MALMNEREVLCTVLSIVKIGPDDPHRGRSFEHIPGSTHLRTFAAEQASHRPSCPGGNVLGAGRQRSCACFDIISTCLRVCAVESSMRSDIDRASTASCAFSQNEFHIS